MQTEINKFVEAIDRADLIDIKLTSSQKDSVAPPAKCGAMIIYEPKPKMDSKRLGRVYHIVRLPQMIRDMKKIKLNCCTTFVMAFMACTNQIAYLPQVVFCT